jgi:hypothetical protein
VFVFASHIEARGSGTPQEFSGSRPSHERLAGNASTNIGRYTFMGDLNPFPGFRQPATGCQ